MKRKRIFGAALAVVVIALIVVAVMRFPTGPRPWCQKQFDSALIQWMMADGQTNWQHGAGIYPNAAGGERESIALFAAYVKGGDRIAEDYGYVPGLRESDPQDLVLMYMKRKTRHGWHGDHSPTVFTESRWMVIAPGSVYELDSPDKCAEGGRLERTPVFKHRLQKTLDFLQKHSRPFHAKVVQEHSVFQESVEE